MYSQTSLTSTSDSQSTRSIAPTKTIDTVAGALVRLFDYRQRFTRQFFGNTNIQKLSFPLKTIPEALNLRSQLMQVFEIAGITDDPAQKARLMNVVFARRHSTGGDSRKALAEPAGMCPERLSGSRFYEDEYLSD